MTTVDRLTESQHELRGDGHSFTSSDATPRKSGEEEDEGRGTCERTPLLGNGDREDLDDLVIVSNLTIKSRRRRFIGKVFLCLFLWALAAGLITIVTLGIREGPRWVQEGVQQGLAYNMTTVRLESVEDEGVSIKVHVVAELNVSKADRWTSRLMLRAAPLFVTSVHVEPPDTGIDLYSAFNGHDQRPSMQKWASLYVPSIQLPLSGLTTGRKEWTISKIVALRIQDGNVMSDLASVILNGSRTEKSAVRVQAKGVVAILPGWLPTTRLSIASIWALPRRLVDDGEKLPTPKIELKDFSLEADHPDGGIAVSAQVVSNNPTELGLAHIPLVNWGIWLDSTLLDRPKSDATEDQRQLLALVSADDATIEPRAPLRLKLHGRILPIAQDGAKASASSQDLLNNLLSRYLTGKPTPVLVKPFFGNARHPTSDHGILPPPGNNSSQPFLPKWAQGIIARLELVVPFPGSPSDDVKRGFVQGLKMSDFHTRTDLGGNLRSSGHATGRLTLPRNIDTSKVILDVTELRPEVFIHDGPVDESEAFALIAVPKERGPQPANTTRIFDSTTGKNVTYIDTDIIDAPMQILEGKGPVFRHFLRRLFVTHEGVVGLRGRVQDVTISSGLGQLRLGGLPIRGQFPISDLNKKDLLDLVRFL